MKIISTTSSKQMNLQITWLMISKSAWFKAVSFLSAQTKYGEAVLGFYGETFRDLIVIKRNVCMDLWPSCFEKASGSQFDAECSGCQL